MRNRPYSLEEIRQIKWPTNEIGRLVATQEALPKDIPNREAIAQELLRIATENHSEHGLIRSHVEEVCSREDATKEELWTKLPHCFKQFLTTWAQDPMASNNPQFKKEDGITRYIHRFPPTFAASWIQASPNRLRCHLRLTRTEQDLVNWEVNTTIGATAKSTATYYAIYQDHFEGTEKLINEGRYDLTGQADPKLLTHLRQAIQKLQREFAATAVAYRRDHRTARTI